MLIDRSELTEYIISEGVVYVLKRYCTASFEQEVLPVDDLDESRAARYLLDAVLVNNLGNNSNP